MWVAQSTTCELIELSESSTQHMLKIKYRVPMLVFHILYCNLLCDLFFSTAIACCFSLPWYMIIDFYFFFSFSPWAGSGTAVLHAVLKLVKWPNVDKYNMPIHGFFFFSPFGMCNTLPTKSTLIPSGSFGGNRKNSHSTPAEEWVTSKHTLALSLPGVDIW